MFSESYLQSSLPFNHLDDTSFNLAIYELSHGPINCDSDRLSMLLFNPIERPELCNPLSSYLDPDSNFATRPPSSKYVVEEELNEESDPVNNTASFSIMHLNARSLFGNFDKVNVLLNNIHKPFSVIGVSETWLNDAISELVNIIGYSFVSNHRKPKSGGGVGIYLQNDLDYKLRPECNFSDPEVIETLFVEITVPKGKNIIVGSVYRPPNYNAASFLDKFNDILSYISKDNKQCFVLGDFNLDLLQYDRHLATQEFVDSLFSHAFIPLISNPTRLTSHPATLIDNIFTNSVSRNIFSGIVLNDLSDHFPVFAYFRDDNISHSKAKKLFKRSFSDTNLHNFNESLSNIDWSKLLNQKDPNESYNGFINEYSKLFQSCFPLKAIKGKNMNKFRSPWLTPGLLKSINRKNRLYKRLITSPNKSGELQYKTYKNKLNHLIRIAKRSYYDRKFDSAKNDLKLTWKLLKEVINKRKSKSLLPSSFKAEGRSITDPTEIANRFCKYFTNIGPRLASAIPAVSSTFRSFLTGNSNTAVTLKPTTVRELENICSTFASGKAPGYDNIPMHVIKNSFHLISTPLMNIINLSLLKGIFPHKLKIAKVIPVYKADDPCLFVNYRPISLLPNFSKFFEKVMCNRLTEFAEKYELLYCCQFGFRKNHSTSQTHLL